MALPIIQTRLLNLLKLENYSSKYNRKHHPDTVRRSTYKRGAGARVMTEAMHFRTNTTLAKRLTTFCDLHHIAKGLVLRDALEFYLGIAEQEGIPFLSDRVTSGAKRRHAQLQRRYRETFKKSVEAQDEGQEEEAGAAVEG